jgi:oligopeptide/dipeptide ABC transporter ATP-binding protein
MGDQKHLLTVKNLRTYFYTFDGVAKAVDDVSFYLKKGEILGIVGESGCGKSVTAQTILQLIPMPPGRIVSGSIDFDGVDLTKLSMENMRDVRGNRIAMIFQEPMTALNPVFTIGDQISEMFILHKKMNKKEAWNQSIEMLQKVQIPAPEKRVHEYPHQMSGGMRQRAMIAMALSCNPEILIADEPTTALDVTIQAQILDLMLKLKQEYETAVMMITHDLGVIAELAERVVVMYAGKVVEEGKTEDIFYHPMHPYTQGLLQSIPKLGNRAMGGRQQLHEINGMVPSLFHLPKGCGFCPRCPKAMDTCKEKLPDIKPINENHQVRCWLY